MGLTLDVTQWWARVGMRPLLESLGARDGMVRFVGGAVRDEMLGIPVNDFDLSTRLLPGEVIKRLEGAGLKAVPTGIEHGTVTAVSSGHAYEVTTLRRDVETFGRHATVAFTDDWREDAARRDFTINALMADPVSGEVFDYFGGLADLEQRHVRFIGDPLERIAEDHLRILRFFRFHARFGRGEPNAAALEACSARSNDLMALSRERIADELVKLLGVTDPVPTLQVMLDRDILKAVVPELTSEASKRVATVVDAEAEAEIAADPLRRLSALLPRDPQAAGAIGMRLKLSNRARKRIVCAAEVDLADPRAVAYRCGIECAVDRLLLAGKAAEAKALLGWTVPRLPVTGGMLIKRGLTEGPIISRTLRQIENKWIAAGFPTGPELDAIVAQALR